MTGEKIDKLLKKTSLEWQKLQKSKEEFLFREWDPKRLVRKNITTPQNREKFKVQLEIFIRAYAKFLKSQGKAILPQVIIKEIAAGNWKSLYGLINSHWEGVINFFFLKNWEFLGGEPLKRIEGKNRSKYILRRFPGVYLSETGIKPDVAFIPNHIRNLNTEEVGELTAIIVCKGCGAIANKKGTLINIIIINGKEELLIYARTLVCQVFGVPEIFCKIYSKDLKRGNLHINSLMVGSYFQNVVKIFELDWDKTAVRNTPSEDFGEYFKKGFLKGIIRCKGEKIGNTIKIKDIWRRKEILEVAKIYAKDLGWKVSKEIRPVLNKQQLLISIQQLDKGLIKGEARSFAFQGAVLFSKIQGKKVEVGEVVDCQSKDKFGSSVVCKINRPLAQIPQIFIEREYQFFIHQ